MNLKVISGIQRTKEFIGKSVKHQNPNIILDIYRENSNFKTFGVKDTVEIGEEFLEILQEKGYSWNTIDTLTDRGRAVDLNLLNPITGKLMIGSSSGTAINVLYGLNTIGIGTDGGGSVLAPAIGLNLYSVLLSGIGIKGKNTKKSTDLIEFVPGIGVISQNYLEIEEICNIFLKKPQKEIKKCVAMDLDSTNLEKIRKIQSVDILEINENLNTREEMLNFLKGIFKEYEALIYLEKNIELEGMGDTVFGIMGNKAQEIQKKSNKGFIKVLNMLNCSVITIPTGDIGSAIVVAVPAGEFYLKSLNTVAKILSEEKRPKLYQEYFLNYPLKEIDNREFRFWRKKDD